MNLTWTGSDVLYATSFPKHFRKIKYIYCFGCRVFAKIADLFVHKHIVVSEHLIDELKPLKLKKPFEVRSNPVKYTEKFKKVNHFSFNVLYYRTKLRNSPFTNWVYGYDIITKLKEEMPEIHMLEVNGKHDMSLIFPIVDFYARPNRHDGEPRLVRECKIQDIPYYHTYRDPSLEDLKKAIKEHYEKILGKNN